MGEAFLTTMQTSFPIYVSHFSVMDIVKYVPKVV